MSTITTRSGKGSPLTNNEVDSNFTNLNTDKAELSGATFTGEIVANAGIALGDNDRVTFGDSDDLKIYHSSSSFIREQGNGGLYIDSDGGHVTIRVNSSEKAVEALNNGAVNLYHDNSPKLATTATGIDVTGKISSDGLEVDLTSSGNVELTGAANSNAGLVVRDPTATAYGAHFSYDDANTVVSIGGQTNGTKNTAISIGRDSNDISFYEDTGTTAKLFWDASAESLGIGTTSPPHNLSVNSSSTGIISVGDFTGDNVKTYIEADQTNNVAKINSRNNHPLAFSVHNTERMRIDSSGNVGIGTSTMLNTGAGRAVLTLSGSTSSFLNFGTGSTRWGGVYSDANKTVFVSESISTFDVGGPERMRIDSSGNVGIGTSSPSEKLQVDGNIRLGDTATGTNDDEEYSITSGGQLIISANDSAADISYSGLILNAGKAGGAAASSSLVMIQTNDVERMRIDSSGLVTVKGSGAGSVSDHFRIESSDTESKLAFVNTTGNGAIVQSGGDMRFMSNTANTERMRIDSSGRVGIGTSSPVAALTVNGQVRASGSLGYTFNSPGDTDGGMFSPSDGVILFKSNGAERMRITSAGNVGIGTNSPSQALHVKRANNTPTGIGLENSQRYYAIRSDNYSLVFTDATVGLERMRIAGSGNVGIGTSAPARQFHLHDSSASYLHLTNGTTGSTASDGASISMAGTSLQISNRENGVLQMYTNGSERMRIDSSGSVIVNNGGSGNGIVKINGATGNTEAVIFQRGGTEASRIGHANSADLTFSTGSGATERMRIDSSGNLLVGKTSDSINTVGGQLNADGLLVATRGGNTAVFNRKTSDGTVVQFRKDGTAVGSISSVGGTDIKVTFSSDGDQYITGNSAANYMSFSAANQERMRIDSSGKVSIGSLSTAGGSLGVNHAVAGTYPRASGIGLGATSTAYTVASNGGTVSFTGGAGLYAQNTAASGNPTNLVFWTNHTGAPAERMRIDSSGNLLVGTTSTTSTAIGAKILPSGRLTLVTADSGTQYPVTFGRETTGAVGSITTTASATAYNTSSDQRLKENIADADDAGSKIDAIQVRKYDWKADGSHQDYGMIAQELQTVAPEAVSGDADSEEMMGVDYSKLVPMLIKEIQSLRNRVAQLETGE